MVYSFFMLSCYFYWFVSAFFFVCIPYLAQGPINPMLKRAKLLISVTLRCSTFSINYPSYSSHQWCWSSSVRAILWRILHSIFFGFEFNNFHRIEWRMFWNLCFSTLFDWFLNDKTCVIYSTGTSDKFEIYFFIRLNWKKSHLRYAHDTHVRKELVCYDELSETVFVVVEPIVSDSSSSRISVQTLFLGWPM